MPIRLGFVAARSRALARWQHWLRPRQRVSPLPEIHDVDRERLLRDIDISLSDMALVTSPEVGPRAILRERLRRAGLDLDELGRKEPALLDEIEAACGACPHWRRCARAMARGAPLHMAGRCPKADRIARALH